MPINPLIALQVRSPDIGGQFQQFATDVQQGRRQRAADERQTKIDARQDRLLSFKEKEFEANSQDAQRLRQARELAEDSMRIGGILRSGDNSGALQFLNDRIERVTGRGGDPSHSIRFREALLQDPANALAIADQEVQQAERFGVIKPRSLTTLSQGQSLVDPRTGEVQASVAPKSDVKSPEAEAQQIRIANAKARSSPLNAMAGLIAQSRLDDAAVKREKTQLEIKKAKRDLAGTAGFEARDKAFAKELVELEGGGLADVEKNVNQLNEAVDALNAPGANLTGPAIGLLPDTVLAFTNPEAITVRETVEEVVQRNLRLILGAQFTQKEGDRLIARAFNPKLSEQENVRRVQRLATAINQAFNAKKSAAAFFQQNGTLKGWNGSLPTATTIAKSASASRGEITSITRGKDAQAAEKLTDDELRKKFQ